LDISIRIEGNDGQQSSGLVRHHESRQEGDDQPSNVLSAKGLTFEDIDDNEQECSTKEEWSSSTSEEGTASSREVAARQSSCCVKRTNRCKEASCICEASYKGSNKWCFQAGCFRQEDHFCCLTTSAKDGFQGDCLGDTQASSEGQLRIFQLSVESAGLELLDACRAVTISSSGICNKNSEYFWLRNENIPYANPSFVSSPRTPDGKKDGLCHQPEVKLSLGCSHTRISG
jgi:hypothetical protein